MSRTSPSAPSLPGNITAEQRRLCQQALAQLLAETDGVQAAAVSTADGFEVAACGPPSQRDAGKLAAITSSLQALGVAVGAELGLGTLESVVIEARIGRLLCIEMELSGHALVLCTVSTKDSLLARSLFATRDCARQIAASWAASQTSSPPLPAFPS